MIVSACVAEESGNLIRKCTPGPVQKRPPTSGIGRIHGEFRWRFWSWTLRCALNATESKCLGPFNHRPSFHRQQRASKASQIHTD